MEMIRIFFIFILRKIKNFLSLILTKEIKFFILISFYKIFNYFKISKLFHLLVNNIYKNNSISVKVFIEDINKDVPLINFKDVPLINFTDYSNPIISIIIPIYNNLIYTLNCLYSISLNPPTFAYQIIIIDDGSTDNSFSYLKKIKGIKVIRSQKNQGYLNSCNYASKFAKGKYLYFLNNDTRVLSNSIDSLYKTLTSTNRVGIVGSKLCYNDFTLQEAGGIMWDDGSAWNFGKYSHPLNFEFNYLKEVDYVSGASLMISAKLFNLLGEFDIKYKHAYCEDVDLCFKARKKGYKVLYQPLSNIIHYEGMSYGRDTNIGLKSYQVSNQKIFFEKWKNILKKDNYSHGDNVFRARERSKNRKIILFIDHEVPTHDQDAGSRTIHQAIMRYLNDGFIVKLLPDNLHYNEKYTLMYQQLGVEVVTRQGLNFINAKDWLKKNYSNIDYFFVSRPDVLYRYKSYLLQVQDKVIFYGQDIHHERISLDIKFESNSFYERLRKYILFYKFKRIEKFIWSNFDNLLYLSVREVDQVNDFCRSRKAKKMPIFSFDFKKNIPKKSLDGRENILFVGGFRHLPNSKGITWFLEKVWPLLLNDFPKLSLNIVGNSLDFNKSQIYKESKNINLLGNISDSDLLSLYKKSLVSIAPLFSGSGIKGKIIESFANFVPVVTTPVGNQGIEDNKSLIVANDPSSFYTEIKKLIEDKHKWLHTAKENYKYVNKYYSKDHFDSFFRSLINLK